MNKEGLQLILLGFVMGSAPFYLSAQNLADGTELKSTAAGGGILAVLAVARWIFKDKGGGDA